MADININFTITVSDALANLLNSIARAMLQRGTSSPAASPSPVRARPPGDSEADLGVTSSAETAEGPSCAAVSTAPAADLARAAAGDFSPPAWLTPQREAFLRENPGYRFIRNRLSKFPGPSLPSVAHIRAVAAGLDLPSAREWKTPERMQALRDLYPTAETFDEVFEGVRAASPGRPMPERQTLRNDAVRIGLRRPPAARPPAFTKRAATTPAEAPEPVDAPKFVVPGHSTLAEALPPSVRENLARMAQPKIETPSAPQRGEPIEASQEAIRGWAEARGLTMGAFDLNVVNKKAKALGHPGFVLKQPAARRFA